MIDTRIASLPAVVLAGGQGTRMRSLLGDLPKVLAPVAGKPFIAHVLGSLARAGLTRVSVSVGFGAAAVRQALGDRVAGLRVEYIEEAQALGTGGALRQAFEHLGRPGSLLAFNGDSFGEIDLTRLIEVHRSSGNAATLGLAEVADTRRFGRVVLSEDKRIEAFTEKAPGDRAPGWINAGMYALSDRVLESIPQGGAVSLEHDVLPGLVGKGLGGFPAVRRFIDIGVPEDYERASAHFSASPSAPARARAESPEQLEARARWLRHQVLDLGSRFGGHVASSLSCVELLVSLYFGAGLCLSPDGVRRDRILLSKGHAEAALYPILAQLGYFPAHWLESHYHRGEFLLGAHPDHHVPGVELSSGSLGHGLGVGAGLALGAERAGRDECVYVVLGDAECMEGSVWEAAMFAAHHRLGNLVAVVDRNGLGCLDHTRNYSGLSPFSPKWDAFGWEVICVDGHDLSALGAAVARQERPREAKPRVIIAETIKGKGVSFMENDATWHVRKLTPELARQALAEVGSPQ